MFKVIRYIIAITIGLLCFALYANIPVTQPAATQTVINDTNNLILAFLQDASYAKITPITDQPGYYYLVLSNVSPYVTYFSERPRRLRGLVPVAQFITAWNSGTNNFKDNNPNGVIIASKINGQDSENNPNLLAIFSKPIYDGSRNLMRYTVTPLYSQPLFSTSFTLQDVTIVIQQ